MSRIGKKVIVIPSGVTVSVLDNVVKVKGPKGQLQESYGKTVGVNVKDNELTVTRENDIKENRALHGLTRALINNMVVGVTEGFNKTLDIIGVGYKVEMKGG